MNKVDKKYFRITVILMKWAGLWPYKKRILHRIAQLIIFSYFIVYMSGVKVSLE